ncbi:MAG: aminomethyl-transferring glycine dehydrogenase subunit GcvPB [Candidatus Binatia bacterium]|nr:aminomethyl-transferring glycine dehydrogenase subunit GcvPB [Candidatus Binatia bacterium]
MNITERKQVPTESVSDRQHPPRHTLRKRTLLDEPLIFERSAPGRIGYSLPEDELPVRELDHDLPPALCREALDGFPEVSEGEVVRHFTRLSQWNLSAATTLYPLGSCTMKYNPVINEVVARFPGFSHLHPLVPEEYAQGALQLLDDLARCLAEISGMDAVSLQPAAGAQGELTGIKLIHAYHRDRGHPRKTVLIPASAHGTNPASAALCGYSVVEVPTGSAGVLDTTTVAGFVDADVAALMVTNPNTLGLFEREILQITALLHAHGALVYMDGANLNALMGVAKPGHMGADVIQFNLHKTFSTPHGGGGPGAGPVGVKQHLEPYLPIPRLVRDENGYRWSEAFPRSIGRVRSFYGNFAVLVRAYAYILAMGGDGLAHATRMAVLNANYLRKRLEPAYHLAYPGPCLHECVFSDESFRHTGIKTLDVAKRLLDYGFYAPTIYFPLVVSGALMIEPTETESKETLDEFADALLTIAAEITKHPDVLKEAPLNTPVSRLDETRAARHPVLRWTQA